LRASCFIEKEKIRPWGLFGGKPGKNSAVLVSTSGGKRFRTFSNAFGVACNGKFSDVYLKRGDSIRIVTSGGGGYGDPLQRDFERIEEDVRQGLIPRDQASEDYCVVFKRGRPEIDVVATKRLRQGSAT
jgi:N-methylhydantoinase B/oxoprolinase/acetone carboxylase alpha subunit